MTTLAIRFSNLAAVEKVLRNQFVDLCNSNLENIRSLKNYGTLLTKLHCYKYDFRLRSMKTFLTNISIITTNNDTLSLLDDIEKALSEDKRLRKEFKERSDAYRAFQREYTNNNLQALSTLAKFCKNNNL